MSPLPWFELAPRFVNQPEEHHSRKHNCRLVVQSWDGARWSGFVEARLLNTGRRWIARTFEGLGTLEDAKARCEALADEYANERGAA